MIWFEVSELMKRPTARKALPSRNIPRYPAPTTAQSTSA